MTNFLFIFTIFCGFGFFSAEDIPQNRQKNLFCPALEKLKNSLEKAAACRKIGFRHADKRLRKAPKTSNSHSSAYQGFFLCHPERSAKDPRGIDREKILRRFAPQNDMIGGFPEKIQDFYQGFFLCHPERTRRIFAVSTEKRFFVALLLRMT